MVTLNFPNNWNEVSLYKFQEIISLPDDEDKTNSIIAILADVDIEIVEKFSVESRIKVMELLQWVKEWPNEKEYKVKIKIDDIDFYLQDYNELLIGERIDLKNYDKERYKNLHHIFSILYKPENTKVRDVGDLFNDKVMIGDVYGALVFFCLIANRSVETMQDYLLATLQKKTLTQ
jgi:hypothetical protein